MTSELTAEDFRRALVAQLSEELTQHCITYNEANDFGGLSVGIEFTDRARVLAGGLAVASELSKREGHR